MKTKAQENALKIKELLEEKLDSEYDFKYVENDRIPNPEGGIFDTTRYLKADTPEGKNIIFLMTRNYTKAEAEVIKYLTANKEKFSNVAYIFLKGENYFRQAKNGKNPVVNAKTMRNNKLDFLNEEEINKTLNLSYAERNAVGENKILTYFNPEREKLENYKINPIVVPEFNYELFRKTEYPIYSKKYFFWTDETALDRIKFENNSIKPSRKKNYEENKFGLELREPQPTLFDQS